MEKGESSRHVPSEESKIAEMWAEEFVEFSKALSPLSQSTLVGSMSLDSMVSGGDDSLEDGENKRSCCRPFGCHSHKRMRRKLRSPTVKRHIQHAFRKPFEVIPSRSVSWHKLFVILPLRDLRALEYFKKTLPTIHRPKSRDQGGRTLLWHAVRMGDELAVEHLLETGHDKAITRKDNVKKLDCCDLAALFEHNHIIDMLDKALVSPASREQSRFCSPFKTCRTARHLARLDVDVQPIPEVFWFDLYEMMPLVEGVDSEIEKFKELALLIADSDSLGMRDQNGATIVWHAARLQDELALKILLEYDQIDENLMVLDHNYGLDALTITIIANDNRMYSALSTRTRDVLERIRLNGLKEFREDNRPFVKAEERRK